MTVESEAVPAAIPGQHTQWCHGCRSADTAPRHHVLGADGTITSHHMDCEHDCPDGSCEIIFGHGGGKQNDELRAHIVQHAEVLAQLVTGANGGN